MEKMKKLIMSLALLLCCVSLAGCAKQDGEDRGSGNRESEGRTEAEIPQDENSEYQDIQSESQEIFNVDDVAGKMAGMQFYEGERILLSATRLDEQMSLFLCREDGSQETLLAGMPEDYYFADWRLDAYGGFWRWNKGVGEIIRMDENGKELYKIPIKDIGGGMIEDMCQLADGKWIVCFSPEGMFDSYLLSKIDPGTGKVSPVSTFRLGGTGHVAAGEEGLLYLDASGVVEINMESGNKERILSFIGTSYMLQEDQWDSIENFRVQEDGSVELLRYKRDRENLEAKDLYLSEVLRMGAAATPKTILSMRCWNLSNNTYGTAAWLKKQVELFNQQSDSYLVVLDECPEDTEREDFARQTSIEMTTGKGPDLLYGDVLGDYVFGAIQKGALVDFAPYMEASGIKEEDYFFSAFDCWREGEGVYGICLNLSVGGLRIKKGVLDEGIVPNGETFAEALLAYEEEAEFCINYDTGDILRYMLEGSEDFWGMLDWEAGTCDFGGASFAKMLQAAKKYGDNYRKDLPELLENVHANIIQFSSTADNEAEGMEAAGELFEDGFHAVITNTFPSYQNEMMAVNANSAHVEGAWEFISFLLKEETQEQITGDIPVHRGAFEKYLERQIDSEIQFKTETYASITGEVNNLTMKYPRSYQDITEEKIAEFRAFLEDARPLPTRTAPLLDIIEEEAEFYFDGTKSIEEVVAIIRNRVQLYMDENR